MADKDKSKKQLMQDLTERQARLSTLETSHRELTGRYNSLLQSEAQYRLVADSTYDWEFLLSPASEFIYTSRACERITGYTSEAFSSDPTLLFRIIHPDDFRRVSENLHRKRAEIGVCELEFRIIRSDGEERWIALVFHPVYDEQGLYCGIRGSNRDISDRKRLEMDLLRNEKYEAVGILAGGIAHDFNNLLTSILGNASLSKMLIEEGHRNEAVEALTKLEEICFQAKELSNRLLLFSRGGEPVKTVTAIGRVLRQAALFLFGETDIACNVSLPEDLWPVEIDESQMMQVARHLITNACEAMTQGGTIDMGAENILITGYESLALKRGRYVKWTIRDHGGGIPPENLSRLFDPYFTTKTAGNRKGMGLGLAICYAIVTKHGGLIDIESTPGKGTAVHIYLQVAASEEEADPG